MRYRNFFSLIFYSIKRAKKYLYTFMFLMTVIIAFSCKNNSTEPPPSDDSFQMEIVVKDSIGNPVPNLRICGGNIISIIIAQEEGICWAPSVYMAKLIVQDTSQTTVLFQDSIYMVYAELDIQSPGGILGYTSSTGTFITTNMKRFPALFNLPEMKLTAENGPDILGTFQIRDTARFVLFDTISHKSQIVDRIIKNNKNRFEIVWQPTEIFSKSTFPFLQRSGLTQCKKSLTNNLNLETTWALNQNFPNPFHGSTSIYFSIQSSSVATIIISDFLGENKYVLIDQQRVKPGSYYNIYDCK